MVIAELNSRRGWISPKLINIVPHTDPAARDEVRLLDYACGAGTVSKALAPYATQTIGLDLSANMVAEYNKAAREIFGAHTPGKARMVGFQHDLLGSSNSGTSDPAPGSGSGAAGPGPGTEAEDKMTLPSGTLAPFDIVVIGMALHHVADAGRLLQRFAGLLKPGGVCIVLDMVPGSARLGGHDSDLWEGLEQGEEGRGVLDTIAKHGFTESEMQDLYEGAGMGLFEYAVFEQRFGFTLFGQQCSSLGFIARGERGCDVRL
ncbi:S-adenosyl-L-methionine-dependent methyltransferase [Aspergillus egyptiacus]|nr:S-adenosyl-L-methionine-dependent methyltransferase [Aspergillus egyptiacus]